MTMKALILGAMLALLRTPTGYEAVRCIGRPGAATQAPVTR